MKKITSNLNKNLVAVTLAAVALVGTAVNFGMMSCCRKTAEVGVVNFNVVREKAKVFQQIVAAQQKYDTAIKENMDKELAPLQEQAQKLEADKANLTGAEISKQMAALEKKAIAIQNKYRPAFERNALASQLALKVIEPQINKAIEATAQTTGIALLVNGQAVLHADAKVDTTEAFVVELDKLVDSVNYPDPDKLGIGAQ